MAKRFTDTDKWKRPWFRKLSPKAKLVWIYLLDQCDHAGIWIADFDLLGFQLDFKITENEFLEWLNGKVFRVDCDKYFIPSFYQFQYGEAKDEFKAKQSALKALSRFGLINDMGTVMVESPYTPGLSMDSPSISIGISKGIGNTEEGVGETKQAFDFEALYSRYPRKEKKTPGITKCKVQIKTQEDYDALGRSIENYANNKKGTETKFLMQFSTFMSEWRDWLSPETGSSNSQKSWLEEMAEVEGQ